METEKMGINVLNDDCIRLIIRCLPIVDRVRLEQVSKRWRSISLDSWGDFKRLSFGNYYWGFGERTTLENKMSRQIVRKILTRCGKFLITISFFPVINARKLGPDILSDVARFCPNIQNLDAYYLNSVSLGSLEELSENCTKLVSIIFNCYGKAEFQNELSILIENQRGLKRLELHQIDCRFSSLIEKLNGQSIESIIIFGCNGKIACNFFQALRGFHKLKKLELLQFINLNAKAMADITSCYKSLESLTLISNYKDSYYSLDQIGKLKNLKILNLSYNLSVNDELLVSIGSNCQLLNNVNIGGCSLVTNRGLAKVIALPHLEELNICNIHEITDEVFYCAMPNLQSMNCAHTYLRDTGLIKLIETSENMEYLNLMACMGISSKLFEAAITATKKRKNQVVLNLFLYYTNILLDEISHSSPLLRVFTEG